jgi:MFS family permease
VVGVTGIAFGLFSGILADRFGRKPVMVLFGTLNLLSILPCFYVISHYRTTATLLGATTVLSTLAGMSISPIITSITESLPAAIRSGGVAVIYAVAITIFGGTTQYAVTWLIRSTGNALAPAWYWTVSAAIALAAMIAMRETLPRELREPQTWNAVAQPEAVSLDD